jgi:hypothetical protein
MMHHIRILTQRPTPYFSRFVSQNQKNRQIAVNLKSKTLNMLADKQNIIKFGMSDEFCARILRLYMFYFPSNIENIHHGIFCAMILRLSVLKVSVHYFCSLVL